MKMIYSLFGWLILTSAIASGQKTIEPDFMGGEFRSLENQSHAAGRNSPSYLPKGGTPQTVGLKSATEARFVLDSIVITDSMKVVFSYNSKKELAFELRYSWEPGGEEWVLFLKTEYEYNSNGDTEFETEYKWDQENSQWVAFIGYQLWYDESGNMTRKILYTWDGGTSTWIRKEKTEYAYDNQGYVISEAHYYFSDGRWEGLDTKVEREYDSNGNKILQVMYFFSYENKAWVPESKREFLYYADGKPDLILHYGWNLDTGEWNDCIVKTEYSYDDHGNQVSEIQYSWDPHLNLWKEYMKYESTFNINGDILWTVSSLWSHEAGEPLEMSKVQYGYDSNYNLIVIENFNRDDVSGEWIGSTKNEYEWDDKGNRTLAINYVWNTTTNQWKPTVKEEDIFDPNGNMIKHEEYDWNSGLGQWEGIIKYDYDFNYLFFLQDMVVPKWYNSKNMNTETRYFRWENSNWVMDNRQIYYYSDLNTAVLSQSLSTITIYPNPVSDVLTLQMLAENSQADFELFNLQGHKILTQKITGSSKINLSGLEPGMYIFNLVSGRNKQTGKFMKD